jgi:hypothetical protein
MPSPSSQAPSPQKDIFPLTPSIELPRKKSAFSEQFSVNKIGLWRIKRRVPVCESRCPYLSADVVEDLEQGDNETAKTNRAI